MHEFMILKACSVLIHAPNTPRIKEVIWNPPIVSCIKCNTDGTAKECPGPAACGGIFRDNIADVVGCFTENLNISTVFHAELIGAMHAIEIASKGCLSLWLETDSQLVSLTFKNHSIVPWRLRNRWLDCIELTKNMRFIVYHIFREDNCCADKLASLGL
ncbi:ribonuclease H [Trifolium pratense]|uniref:Ribonuclease H n=1 Tax=Trifolium pratense TaxID=57577 RepID=A0A2K3L8F8_TRIPR|nr:ribonuclease H [Trifolium pratense]